MSQTIQVNPVELASYLGNAYLHEMYQIGQIDYPFVDNDDIETPSTYTPEGQKKFDSIYDWYYGVITSHERASKNEKVDYEVIKDGNIYHDLDDVIGEYDDSKLIELYNWREGKVSTYTIYKYEDKYILERTFINQWGYYDGSCDLIKLINP